MSFANNSDSENNDLDEKIKKIEEIDEALSQFLHFTTNEENQGIIDSLIAFNSKIESNKDLSKTEDVEKAKKQKNKNESTLLLKQKNYSDECEKTNQIKEEIGCMLNFLDQEQSVYLK